MIRASHLVACHMVFHLLSDLIRQAGVLKLTKNFKSVLNNFRRLSPFPQVLGQVKSGSC